LHIDYSEYYSAGLLRNVKTVKYSGEQAVEASGNKRKRSEGAKKQAGCRAATAFIYKVDHLNEGHRGSWVE